MIAPASVSFPSIHSNNTMLSPPSRNGMRRCDLSTATSSCCISIDTHSDRRIKQCQVCHYSHNLGANSEREHNCLVEIHSLRLRLGLISASGQLLLAQDDHLESLVRDLCRWLPNRHQEIVKLVLNRGAEVPTQSGVDWKG